MQAAAIPYIIAAAGTVANAAAEHQATKERRSVLNNALQRNDKADDAARAQVISEGAKFGGEQRLNAMQQQEQSALAQALSDVGGSADKGAGASIIDTAGGQGQVSGDFLKAKADRALTEGDRLTAVARELAKVRAPGQLVGNEALRRASLTEELQSQGLTNRDRTQAAALDAERVEAPWWGTVGKVAATVGAGMAAGAGAGGAGANYGLTSGTTAQLGQAPSQGFWGNAARIRF